MSRGWRVFAHTAEVGLAIRGTSWPTFYRNAAFGLLSLYSVQVIAKKRPKRIVVRLRADTSEDLLVAWLNELVFLVSSRRLWPVRVGVTRGGPDRIEAELVVLPLGDWILSCEIKSATYHMLKVRRLRGSWAADVILDV